MINEIEIPENAINETDLREKLLALEEKMFLSADKIEIKVSHHFSKGVYAREIFIPKGALVVGKIHKHQNLNIMSSGCGAIISLDGRMEIKAPYTIVSSPGVKRAYLAFEDTVWTTIHGTEETDIDKIEETFIAKTYEDVVHFLVKETETSLLKENK